QVCAKWVRISWGLTLVFLAGLAYSLYVLGDWMTLGIFCTSYLLLVLFCVLTRPKLPKLLSGLSFGVYLWAFPTTQVLVVLGFPTRFGPFVFVASAILLSLVAAWVTNRTI